MVTATVILAASLILAFPFLGLLVGLGPARFCEALDWATERIVIALVTLFCWGVAVGEWVRKTCAKLKRRTK